MTSWHLLTLFVAVLILGSNFWKQLQRIRTGWWTEKIPRKLCVIACTAVMFLHFYFWHACQRGYLRPGVRHRSWLANIASYCSASCVATPGPLQIRISTPSFPNLVLVVQGTIVSKRHCYVTSTPPGWSINLFSRIKDPIFFRGPYIIFVLQSWNSTL